MGRDYLESYIGNFSVSASWSVFMSGDGGWIAL